MNSLAPTEKTVTIFVTDVIDDHLCIICGNGKKLYDKIADAFNKDKSVILSFEDCEDITVAFLAEFFSQLYANFSVDRIETALNIIDLRPEDAEDMQYIIKDVKEYLKYPQRFQNAIISTLGEDFL
jgi:STAS-like domain of unknown function (DUF4325)